MSFVPAPSTIAAEVDANAINLEQHTGDLSLDGADKLLFTPVGAESLSSRIVETDGTARLLPDDQFYTSKAGEFVLPISVTDGGGNILSYQLVQTRVIQGLRRYLVPSTHVVIDSNRPWSYVEGVATIHVRNGGLDAVTFQLLHHQDVGHPSRSGVGLDVQVAASTQLVTVEKSSATYPQAVTLKAHVPETVAWTTHINGARYFDIDVPKLTLKFPGVHDRHRMSFLPDRIQLRVWDGYVSVLAAADIAVMSDVMFKAIHRSLPVLSQSYSCKVRVVGNIGTLSSSGLRDGDTVTITGVNVFTQYNIAVIDSYSDTMAGGATTIVPERLPNATLSTSADFPTLSPINITLNQVVNPPPVWSGVTLPPPPAYYWTSIYLDIDKRYVLTVMPLAANPNRIPVMNGWPSVIPVDLWIDDSLNPTTSVECAIPIFFGWKESDSSFSVLDPTLPRSAPMPRQRIFGAQDANAMMTRTAYRVWLVIPGNTVAAPSTLQVNGVDLATFSLRGINPTVPSDEEFFGDCLLWVALGNFVHLIEDNPIHTSLHRASYLTNQLARFSVELGNQENVSAFTKYGFGGNATKSTACAYMLGSTNWNGCIDDWAQKTQAFMAANGSAFLRTVELFNAATTNGYLLGLPFGAHTAYYTGSPKFDVNHNVVSIVMAYHWFDFVEGSPTVVGGGIHTSVTVALDWTGNVRTVGQVVGAPVPYSLENGPWPALAASGTAFTEFNLSATDAYWCDVSVNGRAYAVADPADPSEAHWWDSRTDPKTGIVWTPTYSDPPGYKADGNEAPYLINMDQIIAFDPLSPDEMSIVSVNLSTAGSYDANQVLSGSFSQVVPGYMHINKATMIKRAEFLEQIHNWGTFRMRW